MENSLAWSRTPKIMELTEALDEVVARSELDPEEFTGQVTERAVETVMQVKGIKQKDFKRVFETCIEQIWGYKRLLTIVEERRRIEFQSEDLEHERKLMDLWTLLMPDTKLEGRITKQWQDIGFQVSRPGLV